MNGLISLQEGTLIGKISSSVNLIGRVSIPSGYKYFNGSYEVIPKVESQMLETKDKLMSEDVHIKSILYYEVSNPQGGTTIIIGGE